MHVFIVVYIVLTYSFLFDCVSQSFNKRHLTYFYEASPTYPRTLPIQGANQAHQLIKLDKYAMFSFAMTWRLDVCSGSVVVTAYDSESGRMGSNPEWGLIYYEAPITAQGLPEPSSLWGSTLGTRAAEHNGCNWACKLTDGCPLKTCVWPHLLAYATEIKSTQLHAAPL